MCKGVRFFAGGIDSSTTGLELDQECPVRLRDPTHTDHLKGREVYKKFVQEGLHEYGNVTEVTCDMD